MNWLPKRKNRVAAFWGWFIDNKEAYFELNEFGRDKLFSQLEKKLHKVNRHLAFEFGESLVAGKREFIVSADGVVEAFEDVIELVGNAPVLNNFDLIGFRQPHNEEFSVAYGDIELTWGDIFFTFEEDREEVNLTIYIKGFTEENEDEFISASFILLDTVIGEYNVGMRIGEIEFTSYEDQPDVRPIKELQSLF
ncbi:hypothetical protein BBH88_18260 [Planococcus antarcticus DSM 14505]|uniref:Uncharacterized protein n=1 Tax=Planococcus antarcticus DSM 14505 TaxID=1185653 RepID=A0ABM6D9D6_9BACL|nr:hypothetical protein [Planococcus antarcticus]ANU12062.1 hypothetical protein BBH88_18260 [Planococcus antarcticus DSM 14505]